MRKNLAPLEAELRKKKEENFELRSVARSLKENVKLKNEETSSLFEQIQKLKEEKEANARALAKIVEELDCIRVYLKQTKVCANYLCLLERKARLYPLKNKRIYYEGVDNSTLVERERMKKLILSEKTD